MVTVQDALYALMAITTPSLHPDEVTEASEWKAIDKLIDFIDYVELVYLDVDDPERQSRKTAFAEYAQQSSRPNTDLHRALLKTAALKSDDEQRLMVSAALRFKEALTPISLKIEGHLAFIHTRGHPYIYYRYWSWNGNKQRRLKTKNARVVGKLTDILDSFQGETKRAFLNKIINYQVARQLDQSEHSLDEDDSSHSSIDVDESQQ